jgi:FAD synthetase
MSMDRKGVVMAFGSFDLIHPGHILYLKKARSLGGSLIVVVARDSSIEMLKHRKPVLNERARLGIVNSLKFVDKAVLGNALSSPEDRYRIIRRYRPSVIAFGYDQRVDLKGIKKWLRESGLRARIVSIKARKDAGVFKSSKLRGLSGL